MARRSPVVTGEPRKRGEIKHLSFSTMDAWQNCPKAVQLRKIEQAPAVPAWWFAGGSAVHAATEAYDRWTLLDPGSRPRFSIAQVFAEAFDQEYREMKESEPDESKWRAAGPKDDQERYEKWMKIGPLLVGNYIQWRRASDYQVWQYEEAIGIEIDLSCTLPGCNREVKAYADRIFYTPTFEQIHIIDLKTGTRGPKTPFQFGTYAAGLAHRYGVKATVGAAFMNREGKLGKAFDVTKYTPEYVGRIYSNMDRAVDADVFPARLGSSCRMCDVQDACYANDGPDAHLYDPDHPEYAPQF